MASSGAWYREGKISVEQGSHIVMGTHTYWHRDSPSAVNIAIGDIFTVDNSQLYEVVNVTDNQVTLDSPYIGETITDGHYAILRNTSGTTNTRLAGLVTRQFNQKQLLLDEWQTWTTSTSDTEVIHDSHGIPRHILTISSFETRATAAIELAETASASLTELAEQVEDLSDASSQVMTQLTDAESLINQAKADAQMAAEQALSHSNTAKTYKQQTQSIKADVTTIAANISQDKNTIAALKLATEQAATEGEQYKLAAQQFKTDANESAAAAHQDALASKAAKEAAEQYESSSQSLNQQSQAFALKAQRWAQHPKDTDIPDEVAGSKSAKHYAETANDASVLAYNLQQDVASKANQVSLDKAQVAQDKQVSGEHATQALGYKDLAQQFRDQAEEFRDEAQSAMHTATGALVFGGDYDASTNQAPEPPEQGPIYYYITHEGTINGINYQPSDAIVYNHIKAIWFKQDNTHNENTQTRNPALDEIHTNDDSLYGSLDITGTKGDYAGYYFRDVSRYLLVNGQYQGVHDGTNWLWKFDHGKLAIGDVPFSRLSSVPEYATRWPTLLEINALAANATAVNSSKLENKTLSELVAIARSGLLTVSGTAANASKLEGQTRSQIIASARSGLASSTHGHTAAQIGAVSRGEFRSWENVSFGNSSTTALFIQQLSELGAFNYTYSVIKVSWWYAGNSDISDTGFGSCELAGCVIETFKQGSYKHIRITRPNAGSGAGQILVYNTQGAGYSPGWRKIYNSLSKPTPAELGALSVGGTAVNSSKLEGQTRSQVIASARSGLASSTHGHTAAQVGALGVNDKAKSAAYADSTGYASSAGSATSATNSTNATNANYATSAGNSSTCVTSQKSQALLQSNRPYYLNFNAIADTIPVRNGNRDLMVRYIRSQYYSYSSMGSSDAIAILQSGYIKYCNNKLTVYNWLKDTLIAQLDQRYVKISSGGGGDGGGPPDPCFVFGTQVLMADGSTKAIESLQLGDAVMSYAHPHLLDESIRDWKRIELDDVKQGELSQSNVVAVSVGQFDDYYLINDTLGVTYEHPFLTYTDRYQKWRWLNAQAIVRSDLLLTDTLEHTPIQSISLQKTPVTTVSLDVETIDNYFVALDGKFVLVHNAEVKP